MGTTIHAVGASDTRKNVRTAMFFHDIAKPDCFKLVKTEEDILKVMQLKVRK